MDDLIKNINSLLKYAKKVQSKINDLDIDKDVLGGINLSAYRIELYSKRLKEIIEDGTINESRYSTFWIP